MDFPVCPSCHQSVIDDDAAECPFCGASMKAKPTSKPASTPPASDKKSPSAGPGKNQPSPGLGKGGSKTPPGKTPPGKAQPLGDDFPFDIELTSGKSAIQALPNPTKQRALKVICPMCDTPGFLPATAAGQDVRCANAKCVMPVFTAPSEKKEPVVQAKPPKASRIPMILGVFFVIIILAGGGLYAVYFIPQSRPKQLSEEDRKAMEELGGKKKSADPNAPKVPVGGVNVKDADKAEPGGVDKDALIADVLKMMDEACISNATRHTKPYCRQLAAEANAVTNNPAAALKHLDQLLAVGGKGLSYYQILPRLDLFWSEFAEGDLAKANESLDKAMKEVPNIPRHSRVRFEIAGRLAAALVAAGKMPDAIAQIVDVQSAESDAQLAARLQIITDGVVGIPSDSYSILPWKFPQSVATTASLINRGQSDVALKWATSQTDDDAKAECLAYWAEDLARRKAAAGSVDVDGKIAAAIQGLPPVLQARVWARAGCGRLAAKDLEGVSEAIKLAQAQLGQVKPPPAPPTMPEDTKLIRFQLPAAQPLLQAATAVAEMTFLQAQSKATLGDAEKSLDLAMAYADATAPSLTAAEQRHEAFGQLQPREQREFIDKVFKLMKNAARIRAVAGQYKEVLDGIKNASQQRFDFEKQLLTRLRGAGVGLNSKVWIIVNSRSTTDDIEKRDDFFTAELAGELIEGLKGLDEARAVAGAWTVKANEPAPPRPMLIEFNERLKKDPADAVKFVEGKGPRTSERDEFFLHAAAELAATKHLAKAFKFITAIEDPQEKQECYRLAAAIAARPRQGQAEEVWKEARSVTQQTDKIAICRGLIDGLITPEK